ncbi:dienelactone hydrolase family protein [Paraburkholderia sp. RL17-347-BIC-D]|uniref:dienelactone hydrolase family protein n=1 Tax=Paraburkholderia sp. RL17-347-BIC-D TaxID=3031632 RepID=UPI0038BD87FA
MSNSNEAASVNVDGVNQCRITVQAKDGPCNVWVLTPERQGKWPGVIFYMDAFGIRPVMIQMASHVASQGYIVLLADMFYRFGTYGPYDSQELLKGDFRATIGPLMASTDNHKAAEDTAALLAYLDSRGDVNGGTVGTVGFCMGGGMALTAAAWYPDRVAAAASFHGGNLATDQPTSPHLQLCKVKAEVLVAAADRDDSYPPEMAKRFEAALTEAGVKHKSEMYKGKMHGWMKPDTPVYDAPAAERGWNELFALFGRTLG